jgi:hypothetical protein
LTFSDISGFTLQLISKWIIEDEFNQPPISLYFSHSPYITFGQAFLL